MKISKKSLVSGHLKESGVPDIIRGWPATGRCRVEGRNHKNEDYKTSVLLLRQLLN
jgi:hypothetical protein